MPPRARRETEPETPDEPGEETSPPQDSPDSSEASSASELGGLLADPGPEFDPEQAAEGAAERDQDRILSASPGGETGIVIEWELDTVKSLLEAQGSILHGLVGKAEEDWVYTKTELTAISRPLQRILNRYDATRVAAATGDELALILGLLGYAMRSIQERKAVLDAQKALEEQDQPAGAGIPTPPIGEESPFQ